MWSLDFIIGIVIATGSALVALGVLGMIARMVAQDRRTREGVRA